MTDTLLFDDLLFTRPGLDRAGHLRTDPQFVADLLSADTRVMWVHQGEAPIDADADATALLLMSGTQAAAALGDSAATLTFLGLDPDGVAYVALHVDDRALVPGQQFWMGLRDAGRDLPDVQASAFVSAVGIDNWRRKHQHCTVCGGVLEVGSAGWTLRCAVDELDHFPRTDPAIIVLVRDADDRALLGRHANWRGGWMSTIAGFVEPGESAEAAVRREVFEETGVVIGPDAQSLTYLGSQPWPFPASLMMGYHALASDTTINVDHDEIAEAIWFSRDEMRAACESGDLRLPPNTSISRQLIERWYGEPLPGDWSR
ncbi:MAG: NAD(+) diphosphatase [Candidatus Nanopelagicales bacterium]|nr:NAD(+) diphosphatase [Candidatus Nanopelagicales bacterium]